MATIRTVLSGSTDGRPIKVVATSSPGTTIHTASSILTEVDAIYLWAANTSGTAATLTLQMGGTPDPDDAHPKVYSLAANGIPTMIVAGAVLRNALILKAYSGTANTITITGYVLRVTR